MSEGIEEVRELYQNLVKVVARSVTGGLLLAGPPRLEVYRLLHSIKAWSQIDHNPVLEAVCHRMEDLIRAHAELGPDDLERLAEGIAAMGPQLVSLEAEPGLGQAGPVQAAPEQAGAWHLQAPHRPFSHRERALIHSLRLDGREPVCCRVWISPDEALPLTRILVLHTRFESLGLIRAELWLARDGMVLGPYPPRDWLEGETDAVQWEGQGGWYRCYYGREAGADGPGLALDQTEAWLESDFPELSEPDSLPGAGWDLPKLSRQSRSLEELALGLGRGERTAGLVAALAARPAAAWMDGLEQRWQAILAEHGLSRESVRWQFWDEDCRLPRLALAFLDEMLRQFLRNTLAHGWEEPSERLAAGKPELPRIGISLVRTRTGLRLVYEDDGRGIDAARVAARAGVAPEVLEDPAALLALICRPEFSTSEGGGNQAGRGMGMNLVAQLAGPGLGGRLGLRNRPGQGLAFTVDLSAELNEITVLVVQAGEGLVALPQVRIQGFATLGSGDCWQDAQGQWRAEFRGESLALRWPAGSPSPAGMAAVLLGSAERLEGALPFLNHIGSERLLLVPGRDKVYSRLGLGWARLHGA